MSDEGLVKQELFDVMNGTPRIKMDRRCKGMMQKRSTHTEQKARDVAKWHLNEAGAGIVVGGVRVLQCLVCECPSA